MRYFIKFLKENKFFISIILSIILGYIIPPFYELKVFIPIMLGLSLLFSFLKMDFKTFSSGEMNWIIKSSSFRYIIAPLIVFPIATYLLSEDYKVGYVIMAIAPTGLGAVLLSSKTRFNSKIVALDVIIQNILAIALIPIITMVLFHSGSFSNFIPLFTRILSMILIPMVLSYSTKKLVTKDTLKKINSKTASFNTFAVVSIIFVAANIAFGELKENNASFVEPFLFAFILASIHYFVGFIATKDKDKKALTSMSFGYRNTSLVVWIMVNFFNPIGSLPAVFYIISQHFYNIILLIKYKQKP